MKRKLSDDEFAIRFEQVGAARLAAETGYTERSVYKRREALERRGARIVAPRDKTEKFPQRAYIDVPNGTVIIGSDFHLWPGSNPPALRAFKKFIDDMRPKAVILNGDVLDFAGISRHPPIGWEKHPTPQQEIECAQDHLHDICMRAGRAHKIWTLGNHDSRFETKLAQVAPEFAKVSGIHLRDHFPAWKPCWATWVNDSVVVTHRYSGGLHATHNNTLKAGKTMVTGHLHSQKVTPFTDYNGTRYGVDTGCIADPDHKAFTDYTEDNPKNWRAGFVVLTFRDKQLMQPELVTVWDEKRVQFRGELHKV